MSLREDFDNRTRHQEIEDREDDDFFELDVSCEGVLTDLEYNELESELRDVFKKYNLYFTGV